MSPWCAPLDDQKAVAGRNFVLGCAGLIGFALGYALPSFARLSKIFYDPLARTWMWSNGPPGALPIGYGLIAYGIAGAVVAVGLASIMVRLMKPTDRAFALGAAWTLTAPIVVMAYYAWNNWP